MRPASPAALLLLAGLLFTACIESAPTPEAAGDLDPLPDANTFDASEDAAPVIRPPGRDAETRDMFEPLDMATETEDCCIEIIEGDIGAPPGPRPGCDRGLGVEARCEAACDWFEQCARRDDLCPSLDDDEARAWADRCFEECLADVSVAEDICRDADCIDTIVGRASVDFEFSRACRPEVTPEAPIEAACEEDSCAASCDRLAQCAALDESCPAIGPEEAPVLVRVCLDDCAASPAMRTLICELEQCDGLMQTMRAASADFDGWCVDGLPEP